MSRLGKFIVSVSVIWFILVAVEVPHSKPSFLQFLLLPVTFCFLVVGVTSVIYVFWEWRQRRWRSLLPLAVCILSVVVSIPAVRTIHHAIFIWSLPSYEAVVQQMESGGIPVSTNLDQVPQAVPMARLTYAVLAQKDTSGVLTVEFLTERAGFPIRHAGYLYVSSGVIEPGSRTDSRWPKRREVKPRWFYIAD